MALPLLLLLGAVTLVTGQTSVCYSSLDCHGNQLNVVLPDKSGASAFASECCSAAMRGLSYSQAGTENCLNCYTTDDFESYGDKFYLGVFGNFQPSFFQIGKFRLSVSPVAMEETKFTVELQGKQNEYTAPAEVELKADDVSLDSEKTRDKAIVIESEDGDALSVVAFVEEYSSSDTFRVMPCVRLPDNGYEYYAVSVPRAELPSFVGEAIVSTVQEKSVLLIVTTEANTEISITLTQDITVDANDIMEQIGGGDTLRAGVEYSLKFTKSKQTLYLASDDDLTGSRVVSNKPIAFFSGHECGTVPFNIHYCDHLAEQLPPAATWGKKFITAPIASRSAVDVFRIVASRNSTNVRSSCFEDILVLNAGQFREFNVSSSSYCYFESNQPLLMVQFSVASDLDNVLAGDPFMVVVPPVEQFRNSYNISTFVSSIEGNPGMNYINILVPADSGSSEQVRWDGQPLPSSVQFVEIRCVFSDTICAYAAQMNISSVSHVLSTANPTAMVNAIVYWLSFRVGHGYFAGMTQHPISLPMVSLDQRTYEEFENNSLAITVLRSGDLTLPITVYLTTTPILSDNAQNVALIDKDFIPETKELVLREKSVTVLIDFVNDVFPEGAEQFEVFLSAAPGSLIDPPAYATIIILNDDPPLPVMNISFIATEIEVMEGTGVVTLMLEKTEGAVGPVSIRIFTAEGTAVDRDDFVAVNDTITFGVEETQKEMLIFIVDNSALEEVEQFSVKIEAISGDFPVAVLNSAATVTITDNDVVVLGFSQVDYITGEGPQREELGVNIGVLFGQLERSVAVLINSTQESTATPGQDFEGVSRVLTFNTEGNRGTVRIAIFDDVEREVALETVNLQLSFVEEERNNNLLLLPRQAVVTIMDDDVVEVGLIALRDTVREGDGSARVNISILQGSLGDASISFIVLTTNGSAAANTDFAQREVMVALSDQNPFEELVIPIIDDNEYEGSTNEVFFVQAQLNPNGQDSQRVRIAANLANVTVNIIDNDVKPVASVGFVQQTWRVSEDIQEAILLVESDGRNVDLAVLEYSIQNSSVTAEDQVDFLVGMGTLSFPPKATLAAIVVPIINDESAEPTEFFNINLLPAADISLTTDVATVIIDDNDVVVARFSMTSYSVNEAAAFVEVAVQISGATDTVIQVNISSADGTAIAGLDYFAREVRLTFSPGDFEKRVRIPLIDDRIQEGQELLFLSLHSPVSSLTVELPPKSVIYIVDNDAEVPPEPSLSVTSITTTSAILTWTQNTNQPVTRFFLDWTYVGPCNPQPSQSVIVDGGERSFTINGLEEGGSYTFGLTPISGVGTGPKSTAVGQTPSAAPTGAPNNIQATEVTENAILIEWDEIDCLDQNGAIIQYDLTLNGRLSYSTNGTEFSFTGLFPQTRYNITVVGVNGVGSGPVRSIVVQTSGRLVQSQEVTCRASADCNGALGDDLGVMTIEQCCTNDTINGFGFTIGESCSPCIVFGFFQDSFVGVERGQSHIVYAGYLKGAAFGKNLTFTVTNIPGTAREGSSFDYTVNTVQVRALSNGHTDQVVFTFRMDAIAQEENETLTLELHPSPLMTLPVGGNVFFRNTSRLTIVDSDEVEIFFTEDDFRANERNTTHPDEPAIMPVVVTKTLRIANPIVLDVSPLTVEMARNILSSSDLPENIPIVNPFSPPYADLSDFDNTTVRITFVPDELANDDERAAFIHIFNDPVNEAIEQVFTVQLHLVSANNPGTVNLNTRPASLCRIVDDDVIRIGFEVPRYTYMEPVFDEDIPSPSFMPLSNSTAHGPIYLAKEDNVQSEQTFRIIVQVADLVPSGENINPATIGEDYALGLGGTSYIIEFLPSMQRVNLQFTLFSDVFPEGIESFLASSSALDTAHVGVMEFHLPLYLKPIALYTEMFVIIQDDDPVIIGFEETSYTVVESMGMLQVNVSVINPPSGVELFAIIDAGIQSVAITATSDADYEEIDLAKVDVPLQFNDDIRRQSFFVTINDDDLLESIENFNLELRFDPFVTQPSRVIFSPNVSTVYIEDDDVVVIGFNETQYEVREDAGQAVVYVVLHNGIPHRSVVVDVSTVDDTALNGSDYTGMVQRLLTFDLNNSEFPIGIDIINDYNISEPNERFFCHLSTRDEDAILAPNQTTVYILDDDLDPRTLRLVDGNNDREGRVEILVDGEWGTVCDDDWDFFDALVVCRQLGLGKNAEALVAAAFGPGSGEIFLDNVRCTGEEKRLIDCPANDIGDHNCGHSEDAGVRCLATAECTDRQVRLVSGLSTNSTSGRLEVCAFGRWGTVCDDQFDSSDAMVVCRQLGLGGGVVITSGYPDGTGNIWLDDVNCDGSEVNIFDCSAAPVGGSNCVHAEDVGVMCQP